MRWNTPADGPTICTSPVVTFTLETTMVHVSFHSQRGDGGDVGGYPIVLCRDKAFTAGDSDSYRTLTVSLAAVSCDMLPDLFFSSTVVPHRMFLTMSTPIMEGWSGWEHELSLRTQHPQCMIVCIDVVWNDEPAGSLSPLPPVSP